MIPHLAKCVLVAPDIRARAEEEIDSKKGRRGPDHPPTGIMMLERSATFPSFPHLPAVATGSYSSLSAGPSPMPSPLLLTAAPQAGPSHSIAERPLKRSRVSSFTTGMGQDGFTQSPVAERVWNPTLQQEFGEDFCKLLIATRSSWNTANNPQMRIFVDKWIPGAIIPDRRTLSGPILDREAGKVEEKLKLKLKNRKATFQTDGWKNKARQAIVATMVSVDFEVRCAREFYN